MGDINDIEIDKQFDLTKLTKKSQQTMIMRCGKKMIDRINWCNGWKLINNV